MANDMLLWRENLPGQRKVREKKISKLQTKKDTIQIKQDILKRIMTYLWDHLDFSQQNIAEDLKIPLPITANHIDVLYKRGFVKGLSHLNNEILYSVSETGRIHYEFPRPNSRIRDKKV